MSPSLLGPSLAVEQERVDAALARAVHPGLAPGPIGDAVRYAIRAGGKRLRPLLCVAAYRAFRPDAPEPVYDLAAALELIHTYSLIHDDLPSMDDDELRRGRAATHMVHGVAAATAAGAALIPLAMRTADDAARSLTLAAPARATITATLAIAAGAGGMVGGQVLDLEAEQRPVTAGELERIHRAKTGALLAASPVIGALAAGAGADVLDALRTYGSALGLAFQITDDILDRTASSAHLGKTAGRDLALEKATFPALAGMDAARARARDEVGRALDALGAAGIDSEELSALGRYAADRDR